LSNGIRRRRIEIRSVDIIESKKKFDAPGSETGRLKPCAPFLDRYCFVVNRSLEYVGLASGDFRPE
jgi:hypothetical protein